MTANLPHGLNIFADVGGIEMAIDVAMNHGGIRLLIPQKAENSKLAMIVGIDAAREIVAGYANERISIPSSAKLLNAWLRDQGLSQEKRANKLHRGRSTIQGWDTADRNATNSPQLDIFDAAS